MAYFKPKGAERGASQAEPRTLFLWAQWSYGGLVTFSLHGLVDNSLEGRVQGMGNKAVLGPLEEALYDYMGSPKLTPGSSVR